MNEAWLGYFLLTVALTSVITALVKKIMERLCIVDEPAQATRKIHTKRIPLGGGLGIFISFFLVTGLIAWRANWFGHDVTMMHLVWIFLAGCILMIGGFLDDKYHLRPRAQIWFPIVAALVIVAADFGPTVISSPFGGTVSLTGVRIPLDGWGQVVVWADLLAFFWLVGIMGTTKLLDGLDGLVTGIVAIGAFVLFFITLQPAWRQSEVALLSLIFFGACLGFLGWNFHPAKIFLGQGGSLFVGFMLGVLAIMADGKIATTALVLGIPIIDVVRVMIRRWQKRQPVFIGDREHLHFKLLDSGLSQRQAVLLLYAMSLLSGITALFLQQHQRFIAFVLISVLFFLVAIWISRREKGEKV